MNAHTTVPNRPTTPAASPPAARPGASYQLSLPRDSRLPLARGWLWLGLAALIGSGLFSVLLVVSRTPYVNQWLPAANFFHISLVLHVDLSVLVWFVAMAGLLWSLHGHPRAQAMGWLALWVTGGGTLAMALSPFVNPGEPIMANYIPVLESPLFLAGLVVFALGTALLVLRGLLAAPRLGLRYDGQGALHFGLSAAAIATAVALLCFAWSWVVLPTSLSGKAYYEILFWGGGHALQFTWTLLMLVSWLWLVSACGARIALSPRVTLLLFLLALVGVFITPYAYLAHDVASVEHRALLTWAMRLGGGPAILPVGLAAVLGVLPLRRLEARLRPLRAALLASVLLFAAGGVI
ncbi:MAG: cytochrome c oxidase subunit I, partial [Comamonadaceae bacterium]|nr:cytochrome c oxidase subunit I [Comamonadaceae bacterium]